MGLTYNARRRVQVRFVGVGAAAAAGAREGRNSGTWKSTCVPRYTIIIRCVYPLRPCPAPAAAAQFQFSWLGQFQVFELVAVVMPGRKAQASQFRESINHEIYPLAIVSTYPSEGDK